MTQADPAPPAPLRARLSRAGLAFALLHVALLGYTIYAILGYPQGQWTAEWMIFLALDFPVSIGVMPVTWLVPPAAAGPLHDPSNFWWPAMYHGIVGTAWWYIVGSFIGQKIRAARQRQPAD